MTRRATLKATAGAAVIALVAACAPMDDGDDIVDIAAGNEDFSTLVAAVQAAGLVDTLKSDGPFTVFAPTNAAFAALPEGTVETLLMPENKDQLVAVLTYHVVPGAVTSDALVGKRLSVETVQGQSVHVNGKNGVRVNSANVTTADIIATNGVIHVIDKVLLPK
ncbi:MAG: fasciclin domain-containing protein [Silicimonas sp.]|nr:fasciclin domain-containing protein [Silicimonas sp.]